MSFPPRPNLIFSYEASYNPSFKYFRYILPVCHIFHQYSKIGNSYICLQSRKNYFKQNNVLQWYFKQNVVVPHIFDSYFDGTYIVNIGQLYCTVLCLTSVYDNFKIKLFYANQIMVVRVRLFSFMLILFFSIFLPFSYLLLRCTLLVRSFVHPSVRPYAFKKSHRKL